MFGSLGEQTNDVEMMNPLFTSRKVTVINGFVLLYPSKILFIVGTSRGKKTTAIVCHD